MVSHRAAYELLQHLFRLLAAVVLATGSVVAVGVAPAGAAVTTIGVTSNVDTGGHARR